MKKKIFISYRNTVLNGEYVNYKLLSQLTGELEQKYPKYKCITVAPEALPYGTLFSPYDVAEFINRTFLMIDDCDKFCIMGKDYFTEDGSMTSIWTEAEFCIWSYYGRTGILNKHVKKDKFYIIANPSENGFEYRESSLIHLENYQRTLLRCCALDFDRTNRVPYDMPYLKKGRNLMVVCDQCRECYMLSKKEVPKQGYLSFHCSCGNELRFGIVDKYYVCRQKVHSGKQKKINIFDALGMLFEKELSYPEIHLADEKN